MSCFRPLRAIESGFNLETGKRKLIILPYDKDIRGVDFIEIPCGKCIGCRLDYSRRWANRLMLEASMHDSVYFVTLTYSDDFLPRRPYSDSNGEYLGDSASLCKEHVSKFMKHVRKHFGSGIRFFASGEYGPSTLRPHYHLILFGLVLDDLKLYKTSHTGDALYTSESLSRCWSNYVGIDISGKKRYDSIGYVVVAPANWQTCSYVARYVTKKLSGPEADYYRKYNLVPPFSLMSRNPGIAKPWYDLHPEWKNSDYIHLATKDKGLKFRAPKYFETLLEREDPELSFVRSQQRIDFAKARKEALLSVLDKSYLEYLSDKEFLLNNKIKSLDRSEV